MNKIISVEIKRNEHVSFRLSIEPNGDLRFEVCDTGPFAEAFFGGSDHEHIVTVKEADKDQLLVALLRDRFMGAGKIESESAYEGWLREQKIEPEVFCWIGH